MQFFASLSIDNSTWFLSNNIVRFYFERFYSRVTDEFTFMFFRFLNNIYRHIPLIGTRDELVKSEMLKAENDIVRSIKEIDVSKTRLLLKYCSENREREIANKIFREIVHLLSELIHYNIELIKDVLTSNSYRIILRQFLFGGRETKRTVLFFIFKSINALSRSEATKLLLNEDVISTLELFFEGNTEEKTTASTILYKLQKLAPKKSYIYHNIGFILESYKN